MDMLALILEIFAVMAFFGIAAEIIALGIEKLEPLMGQGMSGGILLGFLGALPETVFVIIATLGKSYDIAIGAALGGNIILFTFGIGIVGIAYSRKWKRPIEMKEDYHIELYFLLASTILLGILVVYGSLGQISGAILFSLYIIYVAYRYAHAHGRIVKSSTAHGTRSALLRGLAYLAIGAIIIVPLSYVFVGLVSDLSSALLLPALWLALFIAPLASDLGENMSGYRIATRGDGGGSTAIVSFIGGKIQNNTMLIGLIGLLAAQPVLLGNAKFDLIAVIAVNLIALAVVSKKRLTLRGSILLVIAYVAIIIGALMY